MRQGIIDNIIDKMKTIKTADGFETDIGLKVFEWKVAAMDKEDIDSVIIEDPQSDIIGTEENDNADGAIHLKKLTVEIYSLTSASPVPAGSLSGMSAASRLRAIRRDILKAIRSDLTLGGLADNISLDGDSMTMQSSDKMYAWINLTLNINYSVPAWED